MQAEHGASDDRLDDVLDAAVDRRHAGGPLGERDRVDALEAADLEDGASLERPATVELHDPGIGNRLRDVPLVARPRVAEAAAALIDDEGRPGQQSIQALELVVREELDERHPDALLGKAV